MPQESLVCNSACRLADNPDTLYLNVVGIPPSPKRTIIKEIAFCNYDENYDIDKDKWEVDSDGEVGPFSSTITDEKEFENDRDNPVLMGGGGHVGVEDQAGKLVPISNGNINAMNKENFYPEIFQRKIQEKKSTINKDFKEIFKVDMQNMLRNATMAEANRTAFYISRKQRRSPC